MRRTGPSEGSGRSRLCSILNDLHPDKSAPIELLQVLRTRTYHKGRIIPFNEVERIWSWFRIRKDERDRLIFELQQEGILRVVPYQGIILQLEDPQDVRS